MATRRQLSGFLLILLIVGSEVELCSSQCGGCGSSSGGGGNDSSLLYLALGYLFRAALGRRRARARAALKTQKQEPRGLSGGEVAAAMSTTEDPLDVVCSDASLRCRIERKKFVIALRRQEEDEARRAKLQLLVDARQTARDAQQAKITERYEKVDKLARTNPAKFSKICWGNCVVKLKRWRLLRTHKLQNELQANKTKKTT